MPCQGQLENKEHGKEEKEEDDDDHDHRDGHVL
jgi:hypothetical protein